MTQLHTSTLHRLAKDLLSRHGNTSKKLVLFHTVIALGVPLLVSVINYLLSGQIAKTGGLGGMAARSVLATAQSVLDTGVLILIPFWEVGLLYAALSWRRGQKADKYHLTEGFRRFVNVFALRLWLGILYLAVGFAVMYVSTLIFSATPWAKPFMELIAPAAEAMPLGQFQVTYTPELVQQAMVILKPMFIIFGILYGAVCIFLFYRLRFADYFLLEGEGGLRSLTQSFQLTRGNCLQIFKLDLHFWWFYLLQGLALVLCYGDTILTLMGVVLPISRDLSFLLFYAAGLLLEGLLFWRCQDTRLTTYCLAYDDLQPQPVVDIPLEM